MGTRPHAGLQAQLHRSAPPGVGCFPAAHAHTLPLTRTSRQALADVAAAQRQLALLDAELDSARARGTAEARAADAGRGAAARERALAEEQRAAAAALLRQLEAREDAVAQVRGGRLPRGRPLLAACREGIPA
jgi:hypothetical protein